MCIICDGPVKTMNSSTASCLYIALFVKCVSLAFNVAAYGSTANVQNIHAS